MAAPALDQARPAWGNDADGDLDALRDNATWLMIAAAGQGYVLPGWTTVVNGADKSEPTSIEMTKGSLKIRWSFTWSSSKVTQQVWAYDRGLGAGYETLTGGTITLAYDGSDNFTGATTV